MAYTVITSTITTKIGNYPESTSFFITNGTTTSKVYPSSTGPSLTVLTIYGSSSTSDSSTIIHTSAPTSTTAILPFTGTGSSSTSSSTSSSSLSSTSSSSSSSSASLSASLAPAPSPNNSGSAKSSDSGLGGRVVAGIAIACLVGGAVIAGILVWLFMYKRQKKHRSSGGGFARERHRSSRSNDEKALPLVSVAEAGIAGNWERHLDQPESDGTIIQSVKGIFHHVEVHVENFYRDAQVNMTQELQAALLKLNSKELPDSIVGLLPQTQQPTLLIKHCIAQSIVDHISTENRVQDSFLPTEFIALPQALTAKRATAIKPAYYQAYSRWRVLSSYLRPEPTEDPTYINMRDAHITALADTLCRTFDPWAMSRDNFADRRDNMINIMKSASKTGTLLFSQPSTFKWRWSTTASRSGRVKVVVLPGLEKVRDEHANELQRPTVLVPAVTGVLMG